MLFMLKMFWIVWLFYLFVSHCSPETKENFIRGLNEVSAIANIWKLALGVLTWVRSFPQKTSVLGPMCFSACVWC